jgi:hypothetical protein
LRGRIDAKVPGIRRAIEAGPGAEEDTELDRINVGSETEAIALEDSAVEISVCNREDLDLVGRFPQEKGI